MQAPINPATNIKTEAKAIFNTPKYKLSNITINSKTTNNTMPIETLFFSF